MQEGRNVMRGKGQVLAEGQKGKMGPSAYLRMILQVLNTGPLVFEDYRPSGLQGSMGADRTTRG